MAADIAWALWPGDAAMQGDTTKTLFAVGLPPGLDTAVGVRFAAEGYRVVLASANTGRLCSAIDGILLNVARAPVLLVPADPHSPVAVASAIAAFGSELDVVLYHWRPEDPVIGSVAGEGYVSIRVHQTQSLLAASAAIDAAALGMQSRGTGSILLSTFDRINNTDDAPAATSTAASLERLASKAAGRLEPQGIKVRAFSVRARRQAMEGETRDFAEQVWRTHAYGGHALP